MNPELHPRAVEILNEMRVGYLLDHYQFVNRLERVNDLCEMAGCMLLSRQVIAMMVEQYERERREERLRD